MKLASIVSIVSAALVVSLATAASISSFNLKYDAIGVGVPKKAATEQISVRYKDGTSKDFSATVAVTAGQTADSKGQAIADAINTAADAAEPDHNVDATFDASTDKVTVTGGASVTKVDVSISSNSNEKNSLSWVSSSSTVLGTVELSADPAGVVIGGTQSSSLNISIGSTMKSFSLAGQPARRDLMREIIDQFESSGIQGALINDVVVFEIPGNVNTIEVDCNDRSMFFRLGSYTL